MTGLEKVIKIDLISVPFSGPFISDFDFGQAPCWRIRFQIRVIAVFRKKALEGAD